MSVINDKLVEIQEIGEKISKLDSKNNQIEYEMLQKEEALDYVKIFKIYRESEKYNYSIQKQLREEYKKYTLLIFNENITMPIYWIYCI